MVRQWQEIEYAGRYSSSYMDALPNFVKLAEAYGHVGMLIESLRTWSLLCAKHANSRIERFYGFPHRQPRTCSDGSGWQGINEMLLGSEDL
jgi:acetolactate synthase-1/2/3 large subunit